MDDKRTVRRSNLDDRNDIINSVGEAEFYSNESYSEYRDYPCPFCFLYVFRVFLELYNGCTVAGGFSVFRHITWQDIESYCNMRNVRLTQVEVDYLLKMKAWAADEISRLEEEEE